MRNFAVDNILQLRDKDNFGKTNMRIYKAPSFNFAATSHLDLKDRNSVTVTESIITEFFLSVSLHSLGEHANFASIPFPHTIC